MSTECETSIEQEDQAQYKKGGYHPIRAQDIFNSRYLAIKKIGWGHFSTVWLCQDQKNSTYVALKVSKSAVFYSDAAASEMSILQHISQIQEFHQLHSNKQKSNVVKLIDSFTHRGPNGRHYVLVFEILGINLLEMIKNFDYRGLPLDIVKSFLIQILKGLKFLHNECGVIHTDLKPENIVLELTRKQVRELSKNGEVFSQLKRKEEESIKNEEIFGIGSQDKAKVLKGMKGKAKGAKNSTKKVKYGKRLNDQDKSEYFHPGLVLKIVDFGNAVYSYGLCNSQIQTRHYRAPEVILGFQFNTKADIWSLGCIAFELITGELLFQPHPGVGYSEDDDHLASIWETLGDFPIEWAKTSKHAWKFFMKDKLKKVPDLQILLLKEILMTRYGFNDTNATEISGFLNDVLQINPDKRPSAEELLNHKWLSDP